MTVALMPPALHISVTIFMAANVPLVRTCPHPIRLWAVLLTLSYVRPEIPRFSRVQLDCWEFLLHLGVTVDDCLVRENLMLLHFGLLKEAFLDLLFYEFGH